MERGGALHVVMSFTKSVSSYGQTHKDLAKAQHVHCVEEALKVLQRE